MGGWEDAQHSPDDVFSIAQPSGELRFTTGIRHPAFPHKHPGQKTVVLISAMASLECMDKQSRKRAKWRQLQSSHPDRPGSGRKLFMPITDDESTDS